jgi:hypothetical protein
MKDSCWIEWGDACSFKGPEYQLLLHCIDPGFPEQAKEVSLSDRGQSLAVMKEG